MARSPSRSPAHPVAPVLSAQVRSSRYFFFAMGPVSEGGYRPAYGGREFCAPEYRVERDGFSWCTLEWVVAGRGTLRLDGQRFPLGAGQVFRYDRTTRLELDGDAEAPLEKFFVCLSGRQAASRLDRVGLSAGAVARLGSGERVRVAWDELIRAGQSERRTRDRLCPARLEVLLLEIEEALRAGPGVGEPDAAFLAAKARIEGEAARVRRVADLVGLTGLSLSQLNRLFRRWEGMGPAHFLLQQKMQYAAALLRTEPLRVKEVAARVGFADPYHFSRCFRRLHGLSPRAFRQLGAGASKTED